MDYIQKFNETFFNFLDDCIYALDGDAELEFYKLTLHGVVKHNKRCICDFFHEHVTTPYEEYIVNKDEHFFLHKNLNADSGNVNDIIRKIRNNWYLLSEENKDVVWKYLKVMILLDKKRTYSQSI
jgi:hypothetical protein